MTFQMSYKCYQCGQHNTLAVQPTEELKTGEKVTFHYEDIIYTACPHCGQKYAIPNNQRQQVSDNTRQAANWQDNRDSA